MPPYTDYFPQLDHLREVGRNDGRVDPTPRPTVYVKWYLLAGKQVFSATWKLPGKWNLERGYPGDPYLILQNMNPEARLWRVSDKENSLRPCICLSEQATREHARHFAALTAELLQRKVRWKRQWCAPCMTRNSRTLVA